jgi:thiamine transport system substrate-binding protein
MPMSLRRPALAAAAVTASAAVLTGCAVGGTPGSDGTSGARAKTVVVATHDSWAMSKSVLKEFSARTGYSVRVQPNGDVGELTNKLVLTKGSPIADMAYGIDNTFASRAVDEGVLARYTPRHQASSAAAYRLADPKEAAALTPVDYGDVCVNVDDVWFRKHRLAPPRTLDDLVRPPYKNLFVTPGAATSSPGLAFLLATIARYGDGWPAYWQKLMANGTKLTSGWSDAYDVDFTAGGGHGDRPIVLSYASSPPFTIPKGGDRPTTSSLPRTCFRQVEYAGVLKGAADPAGAKAFIDFMTQKAFQRALPDNMYVYPVDDRVALPALWRKYARTAAQPFSVPPSTIARNRDRWLRQWGDVTSR